MTNDGGQAKDKTRRQELAGMAMQGMIDEQDVSVSYISSVVGIDAETYTLEHWYEYIVKKSYKIADAMIAFEEKERVK